MAQHSIQPTTYRIIDLTHDGQGIGLPVDTTKSTGKKCFIAGALPTEIVQARITHTRSNYDQGQLTHVLQAHPQRQKPFCSVAGSCGGCQLQHWHIHAQRQWKQQWLDQQLKHRLLSDANHTLPWQAPIVGADQHYRRRAQLVLTKNRHQQTLLGFNQRQSHDIINITSCPVLSKPLNQYLAQHAAHWHQHASRQRKTLTLVENHHSQQPVIEHWHPKLKPNNHPEQNPDGFYDLILPQQSLRLHFQSDGFIQINADINQSMVNQALQWLELTEPNLRILDLFCGIGNFTLPIAAQGAQVIGVEGLAELVQQGQRNAQINRLTNCQFRQANLFDTEQLQAAKRDWLQPGYAQRILLDPGRAGAELICQQLPTLNPAVIVYISCNPITLIRDLKPLMKAGYSIHQLNLIDLFPHTAHMECMVQLKHPSTNPSHRKLNRKKTSQKTPGSFKF